jgi:hypothetical protein
MTLVQYVDLAAYWRKCPPAHLLLRAAFGFTGEDRRKADLGSLLAETRPGGIFAPK